MSSGRKYMLLTRPVDHWKNLEAKLLVPTKNIYWNEALLYKTNYVILS